MEEVVEVKECSICDDKYTTEGGDLMNTSNHSKKKLFQVFGKFSSKFSKFPRIS
jgi:hypothetical protein